MRAQGTSKTASMVGSSVLLQHSLQSNAFNANEQAHLSVSADTFISFLDAMPSAILWARISDQEVVYLNKAFKEKLGYEPGDIETLTQLLELTCPNSQDRELVRDKWQILSLPLSSTLVEIKAMELQIRCKSGYFKTVLQRGVCLRDGGFFLVTFDDVPNPTAHAAATRSMRKALSAQWTCQAFHAVDNRTAKGTLPQPRECHTPHIKASLLDRVCHVSGVGGYHINLVTGSVRWTAETLRLLALPADHQPVTDEAIDFYTPEASSVIRQAIGEAKAWGAGWDFEVPLIRADGQWIRARLTGCVKVANGKPVRVIGTLQDVTAQINKEDEIIKIRERFAQAVTSGNIGSWVWGFVKDSMVWDRQMYRLYGLEEGLCDTTFQQWSQAVHPDDREDAIRELYEAATKWTAYSGRFRIVWPDGTVHHMRVSGQVIRDQSGHPERMVGATWDVTEHETLATELARNVDLLRVTLESIGDGVVTTDAHAHVQFMNPVAERLTGWPASEAVGASLETVFDLIYEDSRRSVDHPLKAFFEDGTSKSLASNMLLVSRDGSEIGIDSSAAPIRDVDGQVIGVVFVFHDVTEQRWLAKERTRMMKEEVQMKDEFLSHVSHELRSPLASIYSFAAIIADKLAGETTSLQDEYLEIILRNSRQLRSMIDDLLQVTQSATGKLIIKLQPTPLFEAIADALNTLRGNADINHLELVNDCPESLPLAFADPTRVRQILIILLDNAVKFTPAEGRVAITAGLSPEAPELLEVCVSDSGCGIDEAAAERIFEHLYQVDEPLSNRGGRKGLGLGLYIARDLVRRQGGTLRVESSLGAGSKFYVTLPLFTALSYTDPDNTWGVERRNRK